MIRSAAAIDVGSSALRLATASVNAAGVVVSGSNRRYPICLGGEVFSSGVISEQHAGQLEEVFADIRARLQERSIAKVRAVGTAALREARNRDEIVARIRCKTGFELEVLDGEQEGRLVRTALERATGVLPKRALLADLGGGSLELEHTSERAWRSVPLGSVRLLQSQPRLSQPLGPRELEKEAEDVLCKLSAHTNQPKPAKIGIGTGGNLDVLARLAPVPGCFFPATEIGSLWPLTVSLAALTPDERAQRFGLRPDRARVVVSAALVLMAVIRRFNLKSFLVPGTGLREAILRELLDTQVMGGQLRTALRHSGVQLRRCGRRARLARSLFCQLAPVHGLWLTALGPLEAAAYLEDGGRAYESLANSKVDVDLVSMALAVAAAARASRPAPAPQRLSKAEAEAAVILGAIVKVADRLAALEVDRAAVDLSCEPILIHVGLGGRDTRGLRGPLQRALKRRFRLV